ncbi:TRAP transporter transmembrane subunit DctQ [Oleiphilus messinensis]|uniref:TRAP transporter small permease protein n=1 Tax=Oleiphilus messinensis TaxID=141451 RepID=A0A1Y0IF76_9GAMM|nr:TRAP transporter small permease subunit [Oleiphilus messinensis]ARU58779.1 TRAP transporter transmembrane subunit DctQ [Oleiphilus messinensis]
MIGQRVLHYLDRFTEATGTTLVWLNVLLVISMCLVVMLRYVFNHSSIPLQEATMYLHGTLFMLGAAYTLKHNEHVRVDILYQRFSAKGKAIVNCLGTVILLLPMLLFILIYSWPYVTASWDILETSQEANGLPLVFVLKSLIPAMVVLLLIQAIAEIIRNLSTIFAATSTTTTTTPTNTASKTTASTFKD